LNAQGSSPAPSHFQHGFFFNGCSVFPFHFWHFWHFGIDSVFFSYRSPKDGMSQPGYFLAAGFDWRFVPHFDFL
jgi:hypothetical protein